MSILCSPSKTGNVLSKVTSRQVLPFLYPITHHTSTRTKKKPTARIFHHGPSNDTTAEAWFFGFLDQASACHKHKTKIPQASTFLTSQRPGEFSKQRRTCPTSFTRQQYSKAYFSHRASRTPDDKAYNGQEEVHDEESKRIREELVALVDQYGGTPYTDQLPIVELPTRYQPSDGPHLTVSDKVEDEWPAPYQEWTAYDEVKDRLADLLGALVDPTTDPAIVFQLYKALPSPRAPYLPAVSRHKLLRHLSAIERKTEQSMLRYYSVINDMKSTAIPLSSGEWNSAISFAARWVYKSTETEVEAAMHVWKEMEHIAGVKGNEATFNILFDVACKAGKFNLAEMLYKEMESRGLPASRFKHVSLIYYYGLKEDGDGVRVAFTQLEKAGEIIDTVVLNALIASFTRCHEASQVEQIYAFMKEKSSLELRPKTYLDQKALTKTYKKWATAVKKQPDKYEEYREQASMGPDTHTYRLLFNYFGVQVGDLEKVAIFLDQLIELKLPLHGGHFLIFFKGFATHGGVRYTEWTGELLERTLTIFISAIDEKVEDLYISKWIVYWLLKAFAKCSGKSRTIAVWEEIKEKWDPSEQEVDFILPNLTDILDAEDMAEYHQDWILGSGEQSSGSST